jgi:uncharacterized repeat protein (TIGR03803 family)
VVLLDNGGDALTVSSNGPFTFATSIASGSPYAITASTEPSGQVCQISGGSGAVGGANVTTASVSCVTAYTIGGSITALGVSGLVLANGTDTFAVPADASTFTMPRGVADGAAYDLVVQTNPAFLACTIATGAGTISGADVANAVVTCAPGTESVFYSPADPTQDGARPTGGLIQASDGNFYGLMYQGGANQYGAVYKLTPTGNESLLYSFKGHATDGSYPIGRLIEASDGNFYGVTTLGGSSQDGGVFKVTPTGSETVLYTFGKTETDAVSPAGGLIQASDGNFYGTTTNGGAYGAQGGGTAFRITPDGVFTILHSFSPGGPDGTYPTGSLIQATDGNLYGMTTRGGAHDGGTVFKVTPGGTQSVVYSFQGNDGYSPVGNLVQASDGNFYGMTKYGGPGGNGGTVFRVTPDGTETVLHSFSGIPDGAAPDGSLIQANDGNFYGMTFSYGQNNAGIIFRVTPDGSYAVLYSFTGGTDGGYPSDALMQAKDGTLYGVGGTITVSNNIASGGLVFKID